MEAPDGGAARVLAVSLLHGNVHGEAALGGGGRHFPLAHAQGAHPVVGKMGVVFPAVALDAVGIGAGQVDAIPNPDLPAVHAGGVRPLVADVVVGQLLHFHEGQHEAGRRGGGAQHQQGQ